MTDCTASVKMPPELSRQPDHPDPGDHVTEGPIVFRSPPIERLTRTLSSGAHAILGGLLACVASFLVIMLFIRPLAPGPGAITADWAFAFAALAFLLVTEATWIATARRAPTRLIIDGPRVWFGRRFFGAWDDVARISLIDLNEVEDLFARNRRSVSVSFGPRTRRTIILRAVDADAVATLLQLRSGRAAIWREDGTVELPEAAADVTAVDLAIRSRLRRRMIGTALVGLLFTGLGAGGLVATTTSPPASNGRRAWNFARSAGAIIVGALSFHQARVLQRSLRDGAHDRIDDGGGDGDRDGDGDGDGVDGEPDDREGDNGESHGHHVRSDGGSVVR